MTRRSLLLGAGGLAAVPLVAACSSSAPSTKPLAVRSGETLVMIIRHAEKPQTSHAPYGVTADGVRDDESLTITGWTRAGALVELFDPTAPISLRTGLARPERIIAAHPGGGSKRPLETITPLSQRLGSAAQTRWGVGQEAQVARSVAGLTGITLIAWEHKHIPDIVRGFSEVTPSVASKWPGDRFDVVWCLQRADTRWNFYQVPQLLLAGDRPTGI